MGRFVTSTLFAALSLGMLLLSPVRGAEQLPVSGGAATASGGAGKAAAPSVKSTPAGHRKEIILFALSRDGRYALTGDEDENNFLWEVKSGKLIRVIGTPDPVPLWVLAAGFSPDGATLVWSRFRKHMPVIWDVRSGRRLGVLASKDKGHSAEIVSLAFSGDGRYVASGDKLGNIVIWNMNDKSALLRIKAHAGEVSHLVFIPGRHELASAGSDGAVRLWGLEKAQPRATLLEPGGNGITALTVSADGAVLYAATSEMQIKGWNVSLRTVRGTLSFDDRMFNSVAVSPDGDFLAVTEEDKSFFVWNIHQSRVAWRKELDDSALSARFSPDGKTLFTSGGDNWVREWDAATGRLIRKFAGAAD